MRFTEKYVGPPMKRGGGVYSENLGSCDEKFEVFNEYLGISDESLKGSWGKWRFTVNILGSP